MGEQRGNLSSSYNTFWEQLSIDEAVQIVAEAD